MGARLTASSMRVDPISEPLIKGLAESGNQTLTIAPEAGSVRMRQVINKINGIDFNASDDRHMFGDIYEKLLKDLQSAGNAGEFYTPRAVTEFVIDRDRKLISSPAYMLAQSISEAAEGIEKTVAALIEMA